MRIAETHALGGETINRWSLHDGMSGAAQRVVALIIREEEEDVRLCREERRAEHEDKQGESFHGIQRMVGPVNSSRVSLPSLF